METRKLIPRSMRERRGNSPHSSKKQRRLQSMKMRVRMPESRSRKTHSVAEGSLLKESVSKVCIVFRVRALEGSKPCTLTTAQRMIQDKASCKRSKRYLTTNESEWKEQTSVEETIGLRIESDEKIKLIRAQGGCPGTIRRRRSWQAAISYGEPQAGIDP